MLQFRFVRFYVEIGEKGIEKDTVRNTYGTGPCRIATIRHKRGHVV